MATDFEQAAFPTLSNDEMDSLRPLGTLVEFADGEALFKAGDADIDLFVVDTGAVEILNPTDNNRTVAVHPPHAFAGDIDMITRRPVIVTARAKGLTRVLRISGNR